VTNLQPRSPCMSVTRRATLSTTQHNASHQHDTTMWKPVSNGRQAHRTQSRTASANIFFMIRDPCGGCLRCLFRPLLASLVALPNADEELHTVVQ
jgi:hypothetical protein